MLITRLARLTMIIGILLLYVAFITPNIRHRSLDEVQYGSYCFQFVYVSRDFHLEVNDQYNRSFSLIVLDKMDALGVLANSSLEDIKPLLEVEAVLEYRGVVGVPLPGWYAIFVTSSGNHTVSPELDISVVVPHRMFFLSGFIAITIGILLVILPRLIIYIQSAETGMSAQFLVGQD